jgi:hypothetical protein
VTKAAPKANDARFDKWVGWLQEIKAEVGDFLADRTVWRGITTMISDNPDIEEAPFIHNWITQQAISTIALGVRRQADRATDVISLRRLLDEMIRYPDVITRDSHAAICAPEKDYGFDKWAGEDGDHLDPTRLNERLQRLIDAASEVKRFVDKRLAHTVEMANKPTFTFGQLNAALDEISALVIDLDYLLNCVGLVSAEPTIQNPWQRAFNVAWGPPPEIERWERIRVRRPAAEG